MAESQEAAESLIAKSPLTYQLTTDTTVYRTAPGAPNKSAGPRNPQTDEQSTPREACASSSPEETKTSFVIHIFPAGDNKSHADLIEDNPLFRSWPSWPDTESFVAKNLRKSIPEGEMRDALADWETGGQLMEDGDVIEKAVSNQFRIRQKKREDKMALSDLLREP